MAPGYMRLLPQRMQRRTRGFAVGVSPHSSWSDTHRRAVRLHGETGLSASSLLDVRCRPGKSDIIRFITALPFLHCGGETLTKTGNRGLGRLAMAANVNGQNHEEHRTMPTQEAHMLTTFLRFQGRVAAHAARSARLRQCPSSLINKEFQVRPRSGKRRLLRRRSGGLSVARGHKKEEQYM